MAFEMLTMDIASVLIGVGICIGLTLFIYFISAFGTKEKSFEEAIEEQRKRSLQEEKQQKQDKGKKEKEKKFKKWGKKTKDKSDQSVESGKEAVKLEPEPEILEEFEIIEPKEVKTKKKSKPSPKASRTNSNSPSSEEVEVLEKVHKPVLENVNPPTKQLQDKKEKTETATTKEKEKPKVYLKESEAPQAKSKPDEVERIHVPSSGPVLPTPVVPSSTASKKKKKVEQIDKVEVTCITANKLLALIKTAELGDEESQTLIDILLNKQKEASGWTKSAGKGKQEQEKPKVSAQERLLEEKIVQQQQEIQVLTVRIKQSNDQHSAEKAATIEKMQQVEKSVEGKIEAAVKKVQDEKAQLQKTVKHLESENRIPAPEFETIKKSHDALQKVHNLLVEQHTQLLSANKTELKNVNTQLLDVKKLLEVSEGKNATVAIEMETLKKKCETLEATEQAFEQQLKGAGDVSKSDKEKLKTSLDDAKKQCQELEIQVTRMTAQTEELTQKNRTLVDDVQNLKAENEQLSAQLASTKERVAGDGQEIIHHNGELIGKDKDIEQKSAIEAEKLLQEKESVLTQLYDDLHKHEDKISALNNEIEHQKIKNNELREKNWKAVDALAVAEKMSEQKIHEIEKTANERIKSLEEAAAEEKLKQKQEDTSTLKASQDLAEIVSQTEGRLQKLQQESDNRLLQYQSEMEKSQHLSSDLQKAQELQKSSEKRISEIQRTVDDLQTELQKTQKNTRECLQRIFPEVAVDNSLPHDGWLLQFENQAVAVIQAASTSREVEELQGRLSAAEVEKTDLKAAAVQYKTVLAETESVLNRLQDSAKSEEAKWNRTLAAKEEELQKALEEKDALAVEKESFQSTIQQMGRLDEMQDKLQLLQNTIETADNERIHLEQKYDEVNNNCINLRDQIDNKDKSIQDLQKQLASIDNLNKELEDIKSKLEKEKKISKDFSAQMVRLNSLVKIGQDALSAEQENVKKLENQIQAAAKVATANGTSTPSPTITEASEVSSRAKLLSSEKSKKSKRTDVSGKK